jgi:hypothetical protein
MADKKQDRSASNTRMPVERREDDQVNEDGSPVVPPAFSWPDDKSAPENRSERGVGVVADRDRSSESRENSNG